MGGSRGNPSSFSHTETSSNPAADFAEQPAPQRRTNHIPPSIHKIGRHHPASTPNGHCGQRSRSPRPATASYRPASCASRTAWALAADLRRLPVDFGIGVSAGPVFAGNIGAENRYEYTVVGDAVNEAARLADRAKDFEERVLCSAAAIDRADEAERRSWSVQGSEMLRGRSRLTQISAPARGG
jgi:class 3 adenylate cyclase